MTFGCQFSPSTVGSEGWIQSLGLHSEHLLAEPSNPSHNEHFEKKHLRGTQEETELIAPYLASASPLPKFHASVAKG